MGPAPKGEGGPEKKKRKNITRNRGRARLPATQSKGFQTRARRQSSCQNAEKGGAQVEGKKKVSSEGSEEKRKQGIEFVDPQAMEGGESYHKQGKPLIPAGDEISNPTKREI